MCVCVCIHLCICAYIRVYNLVSHYSISDTLVYSTCQQRRCMITDLGGLDPRVVLCTDNNQWHRKFNILTSFIGLPRLCTKPFLHTVD